MSPQRSHSDEAFLRSANTPGHYTSSQGNAEPGPSGGPSVSHSTSSQETGSSGAGTSKDRPTATPHAHGTKRKADSHMGPSTGASCSDSSQHERTMSEVLLYATFPKKCYCVLLPSMFICAVVLFSFNS
jgi:hypothetical protein